MVADFPTFFSFFFLNWEIAYKVKEEKNIVFLFSFVVNMLGKGKYHAHSRVFDSFIKLNPSLL